jgi:hypothetical protein
VAAAAGDLRDHPLHVGPVPTLVLPEDGLDGLVGADSAQQRVMRVQDQESAVLAGGVPVPQGAGAAGGAEGDGPAGGHERGDPGREGNGADGLIVLKYYKPPFRAKLLLNYTSSICSRGPYTTHVNLTPGDGRLHIDPRWVLWSRRPLRPRANCVPGHRWTLDAFNKSAS